MKYRLINNTRISNKTLHKIINFVCPKGLSDFIIKVDNDYPTYSGEAFYRSVRININTKMGMVRKFDTKDMSKYGYYNNLISQNIREILVALIAHELRHLWQKRVSLQDFDNERCQLYECPVNDVVYNIGYKSEKDASLYCKRMLLKWRQFIKNGN